MRVGILAIQHESNTFIRTPTDLERFRQVVLETGPGMRESFDTAHHEVGGFFEGLDDAGIEAVGLLAAIANPSGTIPARTLEELLSLAFETLDGAGPLDGLLVAPHGAAVSTEKIDMDGYWLGQIRQRIGPEIPMICTLDPHANLSQRMVDACNATIAYQTNPHVDQRQRGLEAAQLLAQTLGGQVTPTQACALPPVCISIEHHGTEQPPCRPMVQLAESIRGRSGILSVSVLLGFAYADVAEMGASFVVVTDNDAELANQCADELACHLIQHRGDFVRRLIEIDQAIDQALCKEPPVCLLDMGDNIGGGSPGDGTLLAHAIHRRGLQPGRKAFVAICDPASVDQAKAAGAGARVAMQIGAKVDPLHGDPLELTVTVHGFYEGKFTEPEARHGGRPDFDMGPTAIVETDTGLVIQLTSMRTFPVSLHQMLCCELDPGSFQVIVAKGVHAPVAAYGPVCKSLIRVNTPGVTTADMGKLEFKHRRRPLFPFEEIQ